MLNLRLQRPYRKTLHPGDVFSLQYGDSRFLFGRVIALDIAFGGFPAGCTRLHIYRKENNVDTVPEGLILSDLLIAPQHVNRLGFSRGYMPVVGNIPLSAADQRQDVCYRDASRKRFVDEAGTPLDEPRKFIGDFGVGNYRTMDDAISQALGLPLANEQSS